MRLILAQKNFSEHPTHQLSRSTRSYSHVPLPVHVDVVHIQPVRWDSETKSGFPGVIGHCGEISWKDSTQFRLHWIRSVCLLSLYISSIYWLVFNTVNVMWQCRDHRFPWNAEFWVKLRNSPISAEFCKIWYWGQMPHCSDSGGRRKLIDTCRHIFVHILCVILFMCCRLA